MKWLAAGLLAAAGCCSATAQPVPRMADSIFASDDMLTLRLHAPVRQLLRQRNSNDYVQASADVASAGDSLKAVPVFIRARGAYRREYCYPPQLMLHFKKAGNSPLTQWGRLKMVHACREGDVYEQTLLREYLVYKMYNLFTPKSYRVRLLRLWLEDTGIRNLSKPRYAFLLEDTDALAARNHCREWQIKKLSVENTQRRASTFLALFQYMIGNTDWAVPLYRNIRLLQPLDSPGTAPCAVPYDFDYCGMVNAPYAVPFEELPIRDIKERYYQGFPRSREELEEAFRLFWQQRAAMYDLIRNMKLLSRQYQLEMTAYLDEFFDVISNEKKIKDQFTDRARKE